MPYDTQQSILPFCRSAVLVIALGSGNILGSTLNPQYIPGTDLFRLTGPWGNWSQIDPDYYATGLFTAISEFTGANLSSAFDITRLPPPHQFDHPRVPDLVSTRTVQPTDPYGVTITIKNETDCQSVIKRLEFQAVRVTSSTVTTLRQRGWSVSAVFDWAMPALIGDANTTITYSQQDETIYNFSENIELAAVVHGEYLVGPCMYREGFLVITETTRYHASDKFGSLLYAVGWIRHTDNPSDVFDFDYPHYIGTLDRIQGDITWISNLDTAIGPLYPLRGCDLNCGGESDGDMDGDGIPDDEDDDMDGDGITNENDSDRDGDGRDDATEDNDDDNDGIPDEDDLWNGPDGNDDIDDDGTTNEDDLDVDGDGLDNQWETGPCDDLDGDGVLNKDDGDIDGDGIINEEDDTPYGKVPTLIWWIDGIWYELPLF